MIDNAASYLFFGPLSATLIWFLTSIKPHLIWFICSKRWKLILQRPKNNSIHWVLSTKIDIILEPFLLIMAHCVFACFRCVLSIKGCLKRWDDCSTITSAPLESRYILYPVTSVSPSDIYVKRKKLVVGKGGATSMYKRQKNPLSSRLAYFSKWISTFMLCKSSFIKSILVGYVQKTFFIEFKILANKI